MANQKYKEIKIKDKYTGRVLLSASLDKNCNPAKVFNVTTSLLTSLYAMQRKGKGQVWSIPKVFGAKLQVVLNWDDGYKNHDHLYKIKVRWED